jgi:peptidoglycan hydrolase-like protein with peptidoglycan-binding domain
MSRKTIIETAASQNGTKESPANSNKTKYGEWYGLNGVKWCAIFVSWVYDHAGNPLGFIETAKGYQSCQGGYNFWKAGKQLTNEPQQGDIVLFDWDGNGHCDHTGIFDSWTDSSKTTFLSWEGNTAVGNNSDGGMVMQRKRSRNMVRAFASPSVLDNPSDPIDNNNMKNGDRGANIASLQRMLHNLNYNITVDGFFGDETEKIIKQFQQDHGLMVTGEVTPALLGSIQEQASEPGVPPKKFTTGSYLRKGNSGAGVLALQEALNVAGASPKVAEDGVFGSATVSALKAFQKIKNLGVDGVAGPEVFAALGLKV